MTKGVHLITFLAGYEDLTRRLVTALQDSISADINGATENEVSCCYHFVLESAASARCISLRHFVVLLGIFVTVTYK